MPNQPPTAAFTSTKTSSTSRSTGPASADIDGTISTYSWNWGDGTPALRRDGDPHLRGGGHLHGGPHGDRRRRRHDHHARVTVSATSPRRPPSRTSRRSSPCRSTRPPPPTPTGRSRSYSWNWGDGSRRVRRDGKPHLCRRRHLHRRADRDGQRRGDRDHDGHRRGGAQPAADGVVHAHQGPADGQRLGARHDPERHRASYAWDWGDGATGFGRHRDPHLCRGRHLHGRAHGHRRRRRQGTLDQRCGHRGGQPGADRLVHASATFLALSVNGPVLTTPTAPSASYSWSLGDDGTAPGATASHTYAAAGTYTVTLTVTDDGGRRRPRPRRDGGRPAFAQDHFGRTLASGWGTADIGGAWTLGGTASRWSVCGGTARVSLAPGGSTRPRWPG